MPSHYQSALFIALQQRVEVDLVVRYFRGVQENRRTEGWAKGHHYQGFESCVENCVTPRAIAETVLDWRDRIHVISMNFNAQLIDLFCRENVRWVHWSEMPGIRLADLLSYRMWLYNILKPLVLRGKFREGLRIKKHALGVFGQGKLARNAFELMGIPRKMICDLYYSPASLERKDPCEKIIEFAGHRKVFLSVGVLCKRKGIDLLLKAFAGLKTNDWCVVLCGLDKEKGFYFSLVERLEITKKVFFLGAHPVEDIAEVYEASDVLVLASRFDGWGAVINEAASLGLALIGTEMCGAAWHIIRDGENGFRVKEDSISALQQALQSYVENPGLVKTHGRKAKEIYNSQFSPVSNAERFVHGLKSLIETF